MDFAERKRKVESLLHIKFPRSWAPPPITILRPSGNYLSGQANHEQHARMMEAIEAERRELMKKPDAELDADHTEATRAAQEQARLKAELEEQARFFHQPRSAADFTYWSKVEYWTLDESLALLLGKSPEVVTWKSVRPFVDGSEFAKRYERLRNLALRAQAMNRGQTPAYPSAVLAWAVEMDIPVPEGLQAAMAEGQAKRQAANRGASGRFQLPVSDEEIQAARLSRLGLGGYGDDDVLSAFDIRPGRAENHEPLNPVRDALATKLGGYVAADTWLAERARLMALYSMGPALGQVREPQTAGPAPSAALAAGGFSHWIALPAHERFVPWRRIVDLVLFAKLGSGPGGEDEEADMTFGFRRETARMEVEAELVAALDGGRVTLLGPDSHFPVSQPAMRPDDAVVGRAELVKFVASYGIGIEEVPEAAVIDLAEKKTATNANDRAAAPVSPAVVFNVVTTEGAPRATWQLGLEALLPQLERQMGRPAKVREIIKHLKANGAAYRIESDGGPDQLFWRTQMGDRKPIAAKTISNAVSDWRKGRSPA